jgi:hypothetical protein
MKNNPANPYDINKGEVRSVSPKSFERARVLAVQDSDEGAHTATIKLYDSGSQTTVPVLASAFGDVSLPKINTDVIVLFGENGEELIIGSWYPADRISRGQISLPNYEAGDRVVGNGSGSTVHIEDGGTMRLESVSGVTVVLNTNGEVIIDGGQKRAVTDVAASGTNSNGGITGLDITRSPNVYLPE